jgi:PAS domain S-box-containing protein
MTDYKDLYNEAPVGLWRTSIEDGKFLHANEATVNILGFSSFEELSKCLSTDLYDKDIREDLLKELKEVKEISDFQFTMRRKDGKEITVSLSAKINADKGYLEGTIRDVTGTISVEASALIPHLEKMSILKQHIMDRIKNDCCEIHPLLHKFSKIA